MAREHVFTLHVYSFADRLYHMFCSDWIWLRGVSVCVRARARVYKHFLCSSKRYRARTDWRHWRHCRSLYLWMAKQFLSASSPLFPIDSLVSTRFYMQWAMVPVIYKLCQRQFKYMYRDRHMTRQYTHRFDPREHTQSLQLDWLIFCDETIASFVMALQAIAGTRRPYEQIAARSSLIRVNAVKLDNLTSCVQLNLCERERERDVVWICKMNVFVVPFFAWPQTAP